MSLKVVHLPTQATAEAAWERYVALAHRVTEDPTLLSDLDHNIRMVRAWAEWRDAYLAWGAR